MKILKAIIVLVCAVAIAISAFYIGKYVHTTLSEDRVYKAFEKPPVQNMEETHGTNAGQKLAEDWLARLRKKNPDSCGWLRVDGTKIDYPVMQARGNDPEYYLHHNIKREKAFAGALFASAGCDMSRPSDNVVIFGHHMKAGTMFGTLKNFESEKFAKGNLIHLYTVRGWETYRAVAVYKVSVSGDRYGTFKYHSIADFKTQTELDAYMEDVRKRELFRTGEDVAVSDKFLSLSTCEYSQRGGRLVVLAKRLTRERGNSQ
jgi:sortase B